MALDFSYLDELIEEEAEEVAEGPQEGYRHVWVIAETTNGAVTPAALEVMGQGRDIADQFGVYLFGLLLGDSLDDSLGQMLISHGADKVFLVEDPDLAHYQVEIYTKALADLINERRPEIILLPASPLMDDLAPRLAQRLDTGLIAHCVKIALDMAERQLLGTFPWIGDDVFHTLACPDARPQMATLEAGAFRAPYADPYRSGEIERVSPALEGIEGRVNWLELNAREEKRAAALNEARLVVSLGRGIRDDETFALAQQLAGMLDGQVAGSRGALDRGWISEEQQVGMTGQTVSPALYLACGISGAIQHVLGMEQAGFIVAINRDEDAPIMQVANVGVVGDVKELLSALVEELAAVPTNGRGGESNP